MKVTTVIGTRPEIIKMAPIIPLLDEEFEHTFVFSSQHFSDNMVRIFLDEMQVREPDIFLGTESSDVDILTGATKKVLDDINPDMVLVYGDTNSTLAAARAIPEKTKLAHIEAGIRSFDKRMPEELNRIETDSISDLHLAPTGLAKYFLTDYEGYSEDSIEVVGNLVVDAYFRHKEKIDSQKLIEQVNSGEFYLLTMHRVENVDFKERLSAVINNLASLDKPVVFPAHPRTVKQMKEFGIKAPENAIFLEPLGYFEFMKLFSSCDVVITDSGGVQEEAITLGVPCVTLRENTERMETVFLGANVLFDAGYRDDLNKVVKEYSQKREYIKKIKNPFGDGNTSRKIVDVIKRYGD